MGLFGDALRGFLDGLSGDIGGQQRKQREAEARQQVLHGLGQLAISEADLQAYMVTKLRQYNDVVAAERARGNGAYPEVEMTDGWLSQCRAVTRFNMNGQLGRVEIFYGGSSNNPLYNEDHGHIVMLDYGATMVSWEEPGPKGQRNRLY